MIIIVSLTSSEVLLNYVEQMEERGFNIVWNIILYYIALSFPNFIRAMRRYTISLLTLCKKLLLFFRILTYPIFNSTPMKDCG